ncbi:uncharacterized protein METZ01_LOCUS273946, partial [marine metagenome]
PFFCSSNGYQPLWDTNLFRSSTKVETNNFERASVRWFQQSNKCIVSW